MVGLIVSFMPLLFWAGIPITVAALALAWTARRRARQQRRPAGLANAGLVLGTVGLLVGLAIYALVAFSYYDIPRELARLASRIHPR